MGDRMFGKSRIALLVMATAALGAGGARAAAAGPLAPLPPGKALSTHGPFEMGVCEACHKGKGSGGQPGPVVKKTNALCFDCHDDYAKPMKGHPSPSDPCLICHSPHNAKKKKLLTR